jgi:hypothetical protein
MKGKRLTDAEAKANLDRIEAQSEKLLGTVASKDSEEKDWPERWGKRLGLVLGYGLAIYLLWYLFRSYFLL